MGSLEPAPREAGRGGRRPSDTGSVSSRRSSLGLCARIAHDLRPLQRFRPDVGGEFLGRAAEGFSALARKPLNREIVAILHLHDIVERLSSQGAEALGSTPWLESRSTI